MNNEATAEELFKTELRELLTKHRAKIAVSGMGEMTVCIQERPPELLSEYRFVSEHTVATVEDCIRRAQYNAPRAS